MNIVDFTNQFQKLEIEWKFFEAKDSEGMLYWDIVRHDAFYYIYYELSAIKFQSIETKRKSKLSLVKTIFKVILGTIYFNFRIRFKKYKYVFIVASRNKDSNGFSIDQACDDALSIVFKDSLIIETFNEPNKRKKYNSVLDYNLLYSNYKKQFFSRVRNNNKSEVYEVSKYLKDGFKVDLNFNDKIFEILSSHLISESYYIDFLKITKPKCVFLVQNGIQKGLFAAAKKVNIPTIEFQHGFIGYVHPAYHYPEILNLKKTTILPNFFFTFSSFWATKLNYPVNSIIGMGNSFYSLKLDNSNKIYDLMFIFANIYTIDLLIVIDNLLQDDYKGKICIKLHPNQVNELISLKNKFKDYSNIHIVSIEMTLSQVLSVSKSVVAVQSTGVYEALHYGLKVFIIKVKDYQTHEDVFDNPNVYLINNNNDIINLSKRDFISSYQNIMFEDFKKELFSEFIQKLEK